MFTLEINPWQIMLDVLNEKYPGFDAEISFLEPKSFKETLQDKNNYDTLVPDGIEDACGFTFFDNEGKKPIIVIDSEIPCYASVEIIAHEAAHVIAGHGADHGEQWEAVFDEIYVAYCAKMAEICDAIDQRS
jgi:hypothetical protein